MKRLITLFALISLTGCADHTYRFYEFESDRVSLEQGDLGVSLSAKYVKVSENPKITNYGNPYRFLITFSAAKEELSPHTVKNIKVTTEDGVLLYEFEGGGMKAKWSDYSKNWFSSWSHEGLKLEHIPFTIRFDLIFQINGKTITESVTKKFKPKYKEEKRNDFFDGASSA